MRYTALDFETANRQRTSVCSVGISVYENGIEVGHYYSLVRPEPCRFDWFCTQVHGLCNIDVATAPTFGELYPQIFPLLQGNIVCHNAVFDIGCLRALCLELGLEKPDAAVHCTLKLARKIIPGKTHKLNVVADHFGLGAFRHHNALDDARICAEIFSRFHASHPGEISKHSSKF